jgi:hypothetical protein
VPRDDHLDAFVDRLTVFAPRASHAARAGLREQNLAGAAGPNRAADDAEQTDDFVVVRIGDQRTLAMNQNTSDAPTPPTASAAKSATGGQRTP